LIPYQTNKVTAGRGGVFLSEEIELNLASTYSAKSAQMLCSSHGKEFILKLVYMLIIFTLMIYMVHWCLFFEATGEEEAPTQYILLCIGKAKGTTRNIKKQNRLQKNQQE
jgi:hypothetical protein